MNWFLLTWNVAIIASNGTESSRKDLLMQEYTSTDYPPRIAIWFERWPFWSSKEFCLRIRAQKWLKGSLDSGSLFFIEVSIFYWELLGINKGYIGYSYLASRRLKQFCKIIKVVWIILVALLIIMIRIFPWKWTWNAYMAFGGNIDHEVISWEISSYVYN